MDESVAQSPEQQRIITSYEPQGSINPGPETIISSSTVPTTAITTTALELQTHTPSQLFIHPAFYRNSVEDTRKSENDFIFYKCRFCGLTYNYLTTLRAHERVHNIDEPYKCSRCSESFHYMCELEYHAKQHTDLKGYKCECGRTFHSYTDLLYHKHPDEESIATASITEIPENNFPVPEFIEKGFEPKHPLKVYSDVRTNPYICQYCSKSYPNSRMLAYHMYGHRGEKIFNPRASRYLMARTENSYITPRF
ncbi:Zinc finger protein [Dirofilaria immitis]